MISARERTEKLIDEVMSLIRKYEDFTEDQKASTDEQYVRQKIVFGLRFIAENLDVEDFLVQAKECLDVDDYMVLKCMLHDPYFNRERWN